jgi:hypothetical protein
MFITVWDVSLLTTMLLLLNFLLFSNTFRSPFNPSVIHTLQPVCAFGSAQNLRQVNFTSTQWPDIPIWFVLWGQDASNPEVAQQISYLEKRIRIIDGLGTNHAQGWAKAYHEIKSNGFQCDYFPVGRRPDLVNL